MKTKTFNGIKIKNTEFSMGEKLFGMDKSTALKYKKLAEIDYKNNIQSADRRNANVVKRIIKNIDLYINGLAQ